MSEVVDHDIIEAKRKRQKKKMTKILSKAWGLDHADPFQEMEDDEIKALTTGNSPMDLTSIGHNLEKGVYQHGRKGWEQFACDLGGIYNRYIVCGKKAKLAKNHLNQVKELLSNIDAHLSDLAHNSKPDNIVSSSSSSNKQASNTPTKRKVGELLLDGNGTILHVPKKKNSKQQNRNHGLTLSQREEKAMKELMDHVINCGGDESQLNSFRCKVEQVGERYQTAYYSEQGRKFKSVGEVSKFLNLSDDKSTSVNSASNAARDKTTIPSKRQPKNSREVELEKKKLKRELDKLIKNHVKASKALDDFQNEQSNEQMIQMDDDMIPFDAKKNKVYWSILTRAEMDGFPGIPVSCTQEVLMVWDFLCTFHRTLSLHPIDLDNFAAALIYKPRDRENDESGAPLYLIETHLALLRLLLNDVSSDSWWWSTLETPESEAKEEINKGEADNIAPTMKVDFAAIVDYEEDPSMTRKWIQALEDVRTRRANAGGAIKAIVKTAVSLTCNPFVKSYLRKAMRGWKGSDAAFTKQSVMWLIGRVREARPDLWGKQLDASILKDNKEKVVREAMLSVESLDEGEIEEHNLEEIQYGDSEAEDSDSDEEENEVETEEDFSQKPTDSNAKVSNREEDLSAPVTTNIPTKPPPHIVDLLLPPYKPQFTASLISPFSWSYVVGASVSRILHRYKRLRNEVDDNLREFRDFKPLSIGERRRRERIAAFRIFSECVAEKENGSDCPIEAAVDHLCSGKDYLTLSALQRLCILRVLIEAAYDTQHVYQCIQDNINARRTASKQLENEERRAKKDAKEEAANVETAARNRLAHEARDEFLSKKRREVTRNNKYTNEFKEGYLESLQDDEIINFDEETKAEYEALPGPKQFNKNEVQAMVNKINEEAAFNTTELEVLTLDEIESRENNTLIDMEEELASYGENDICNKREVTAKIDNLNREIKNFKEWQASLPASRSEAIETLKDAIEDGTIKALRSAIKVAKQALLCGDDEETGGMWTLDLLRDAALELKQAEKRKRVTEAQKEMVGKINKCFVRRDVIGKDRYFHNFWYFDHDDNGGIWYDANFKLHLEAGNEEEATPRMHASDIVIGAKDEEDDLRGAGDRKFLRFSRQEYHPSGEINSLARRHNGCICSSNSMRRLLKNLDGRGHREGSLKSSLKEILEAGGYVNTDSDDAGTKDDNAVNKSGDEEHFQRAKNAVKSNSDTFNVVPNLDMIESLSSAISQRCRLRFVADEISAPDASTYSMATVTGWRTRKIITNYPNMDSDEPTIVEKEEVVWIAALDHGSEKELSSVELLNGLVRSKKWRHQYPGYYEHDSPLFSYRNKIGRFCGRAADAPYASSHLFFSKLMIKREQDFYALLKSRIYDNNWGGKMGLRNAWINSMKENFDDINTLREGLLTLEDAFHELCGQPVIQNENENTSPKTPKELLENDDLRCDIELESLGSNITGLWNSYESRAIFREIISNSNSLGMFALGHDLICRNCQAYLDATKPTVTTRNASSNVSTNYDSGLYTSTSSGRLTRSAFSTTDTTSQSTPGRRLNLWQQQHSDY